MKQKINGSAISERAKYFVGCIMLQYTALVIHVEISLKLLLNRKYRLLKIKISIDITSESSQREYCEFKSPEYNFSKVFFFADRPTLEFVWFCPQNNKLNWSGLIKVIKVHCYSVNY